MHRQLILIVVCLLIAQSTCNINDNGESETEIKNWRRFVAMFGSGRHYRHSSHKDRKLNHQKPTIIDLTGIDPCENVTCPSDEICIAHQKHTAMCIPNEEIEDFVMGHCSSCRHHSHPGLPVCGENGQTFQSLCQLEYVSCLLDTDIRAMCAGECPCMEPFEIPEPRDLEVIPLPQDAASAHVGIRWLDPAGFENEIEEYEIFFTKRGSDGWKTVRAPGYVNDLDLAGIKPGAEYYFRIRGIISGKEGRMSDAFYYATPQDTSDLGVDTEFGDITDDEDISGDHSDDEDL